MTRPAPAPVSVPVPVPGPVPGAEAPLTLDALAADAATCRACGLCETRSNVVFGEGHPRARLVFVGEGPGQQEDATGRPFVGKAGRLLTKMIEAMGLKREDVYICNVVKCRPPQNRNPEPAEIAACGHYLQKQLQSIQPEVIVTLGKFAAQVLLESTDGIMRLRGREYEYAGAKLIPTFHPAYLLRNPAGKKDAWSDLKKAARALGLEIPNRGARS